MQSVEVARQPRRGSGEGRPGDRWVGRGRTTERLRRTAAFAAESPSTVLITGETGTGKNEVARWIHRASERNQGPFLHVDCASLSPHLVESELFGHERGAFTGAVARRAGRFERVGDGTLFLDEIGELEPGLQAKLLRVLEEREFEALGGSSTRRMRGRVIAATSRVLEEEVEAGRFRADLFYRLHILRVEVPPLRERMEDLPDLAGEALRRASERLSRPPPPLRADFVDALARHHWPGNVRELFNLVEAALVHSRGDSPGPERVAELLANAPRPSARPSILRRASLLEGRPDTRPAGARVDGEVAERAQLTALLQEAGGNIARVARKLGLPRSTLRYRIRRLGLEDLVPRE